MPSQFPDDLVPPNLTGRSLNACRGALDNHYNALRRQGVEVTINVDDVLVDNGDAIRAQGQSIWSSVWSARGDDTTPADALRTWRAHMADWAATNLIG
jgi:hypothetical protein